MKTMLTPLQRARIQATVRRPGPQTTPNPELAAVVAQLRAENPAAFHTPETLATRVFAMPPKRDFPCATGAVEGAP